MLFYQTVFGASEMAGNRVFLYHKMKKSFQLQTPASFQAFSFFLSPICDLFVNVTISVYVIGSPLVISQPSASISVRLPQPSAMSSPVHCLTLSSHRFLCLPLLLAPLTVPCKMAFARPDGRETRPLSSPSSCSPHNALQDGLCQAG